MWNLVELILFVVFFLVVVMLFLKGKYISLYVKSVKFNFYDIFSFDNIVCWLDWEILWFVLVMFIIILKFLRFIRFNYYIC